MSDDLRCPSCGHVNEAGAAECAQCGFPLHPETGAASAPPPAPAPKPAAPAGPEPAPAEPTVRGFDPSIRRVRPIRPRPPRGPDQRLQMQLWLLLGGLAVAIILFTAFQGFQKNNPSQAPVEGAMDQQQHIVDMARAELAKDSLNVNARIALANVLYDTANWSDAIVNYRSALRLDPGRIETIVDMGVCYYNLSATDSALALFHRALKLDANHAITLFNLGIVYERQNKLREALEYYQRAQKANPPEGMAQQLQQAMQRVQAQTR